MNKYGKTVDKTFLSVDNAEKRGFLHRDYIAHCLRWSHVVKRLSKGQAFKTAEILDVGCGKEAPLAKLLYSSKMTPGWYFGIDYGLIETIDFGSKSEHYSFYPETDFVEWHKDTAPATFSHVVCFEVLEHVEPKHCIAILKAIHERLVTGGEAYISTPCWNGKAAGNHVNEIKYEVMGALLETCGFEVIGHYGTFASQSDYVHRLTENRGAVYDQLKDYYDSNVLACIFAPLYPGYSRNCLWVVTHKRLDYEDQFPQICECSSPWSSSDRWEELGEY